MAQTVEEKNNAIVREAFETLFNKRDYEAAERYWSPITFNIARTYRRVARAFST